MLVTAGGQEAKDDKAVHAWLQTPEGLQEVAKYATIYAPNFNLVAKPSEDGQSYVLTGLAEKVRESGM